MAEILNYSRVLYTGVYRYRSKQGLIGLAVFIIIDAALFWRAAADPDTAPVNFKLVIPCVIFIPILILGVSIAMDRKNFFQITISGITTGRKFVPWSEIDRFGAAGSFGGRIEYMFYTRKGLPSVHRRLMCGPDLPSAEFDELARQLRAELSATYPALKLGVYESRQDNN